MDTVGSLKQKGIKKLEAREKIAAAITDGSFSLGELQSRIGELKEKQIATVLEAIEEVTGRRERPALGVEYLRFAEDYILSENNSCKREASRVTGNMAADYPSELDGAVEALLRNTGDSGTVVRWGSAYALSRIIILERYRDSALVQKVKALYEAEQENGVKNQYKKALRRIKAI